MSKEEPPPNDFGALFGFPFGFPSNHQRGGYQSHPSRTDQVPPALVGERFQPGSLWRPAKRKAGGWWGTHGAPACVGGLIFGVGKTYSQQKEERVGLAEPVFLVWLMLKKGGTFAKKLKRGGAHFLLAHLKRVDFRRNEQGEHVLRGTSILQGRQGSLSEGTKNKRGTYLLTRFYGKGGAQAQKTGKQSKISRPQIRPESRHTVDGRNPAPPQRPWKDDSPVNTNK